jgi:hypothetical protein
MKNAKTSENKIPEFFSTWNSNFVADGTTLCVPELQI